MKSLLTRTRIVLLVAVSTLTGITACGHDKSKTPADAASTIKLFYAEYIGEWLSDDADFDGRIQTVKERYLSAEMLDKLQTTVWDFDPFLQAQDCDRSMLEKLSVEPFGNHGNTYRIGLWDSFNGVYRTILLTVDAEDRISDIEFDIE